MSPKPKMVEYADRREWHLDGQRHREDGPAVEYANGSRAWWIDGEKLTEEEFNTHRFRIWAVEGRLLGQEEQV